MTRDVARVVASLCFPLVAVSCQSGDVDAPPPPPSAEEIRFVDVAAQAGITAKTVCGNLDKNHLLESTGSGLAIADFDGDGDDDIYVATAQTLDDWLAGERPRPNALYRNNGDGTFTDVAEEAGVDLRAWSCGPYFVDYDNDGDRDLFVTTWGENVLYRNDGDGTFTDVTREAGIAGPGDAWSASAAFGDLDNDGDLDAYVANYCSYDLLNPPFGGSKTAWKGIMTYRGPLGFEGQPDLLYRNEGDGTFTEIAAEAGISEVSRKLYGLGVVMSDLDDDADLDIYVANDSCPNFLWRNDGDLRFTEVANVAGVSTNEDAKEQAGMGTDAADFNGDGKFDLIVTNFSHDWNTLYANRGGLAFVDVTWQSGLKDGFLPLAWGTKFLDVNNDGAIDLFVANGHIYPEVDEHPDLNTTYGQTNLLYLNRGEGRFENVSASSGPGLAIAESSRGLAVADLDRDGDLDLVVTNIDSTPSLLRNETGNEKSWISVRLVGTRGNRDAIGSRVAVEAGGLRQVREVNPFGSYQSQGTYEVHFGLGGASRVTRLSVRWPSGEESEFLDLPVRRFVTVTEGSGDPEVREP